MQSFLHDLPVWLATFNMRTVAEIYQFRKLARADARLRSLRLGIFSRTKPEKVMIIWMNHHTAGFIAYFTFALNQLCYSQKHDYLPVVHFGRRAGAGVNAYYDPRYGGNMWAYYFEPVAGVTYEDIEALVADPRSDFKRASVMELSSEHLTYLHSGDPDSVFAYPHGVYQTKFDHDLSWYQAKRLKANGLIRKYVKIKKHIQDEIALFFDAHMKASFVVGVHLRGTDKGTQPGNPRVLKIIEPEAYFERLTPILEAHPSCKMFVATDQQQYLDLFKSKYGDRVLCWDSLRSKTKNNAFIEDHFKTSHSGSNQNQPLRGA